jgi:hypothetical protein
MKIIYRVSPFEQDNPSPIYSNEKEKLVKLCYESFKKANSGFPVLFLLDRCDYDFFEGDVVHFTGVDKNTSLRRAYELARELDDKVLFVEDDYLWRPNTIKFLEPAIDEFTLVSPYDHPSHYLEDKFPDEHTLKIFQNNVWRKALSNTHTFGVHSNYLSEHWDIFYNFGVNDHAMFQALPNDIWQPTYSFATHMVYAYMAPNINWKSIWTKLL